MEWTATITTAAISAIASLIASGCGAYFGSYLARKGQNLATKEDFDEVLRQLRESTNVTEQIRGEVHARFSDASALKALKRDRLEKMMSLTFDVDDYLIRATNAAERGQGIDGSNFPANDIAAYATLYFPKLLDQVMDLLGAVNEEMRHILALVEAGEYLDSKVAAREAKRALREIQPRRRDAMTELRKEIAYIAHTPG